MRRSGVLSVGAIAAMLVLGGCDGSGSITLPTSRPTINLPSVAVPSVTLPTRSAGGS